MTATPHLTPIERPTSLVVRGAYAFSRHYFGKVMTVMKVIYARKPQLALVAQKIITTQEKLSLEPDLRFLVQVKVSQMNNCPFCEDITLAYAFQKRVGTERFQHLNEFSTSGVFTPREKAALAFVEEATQHRKVSEATWAQVKAQFNEIEIVELTWLNAAEDYFNLQAAVLGIGADGLAQIARGK